MRTACPVGSRGEEVDEAEGLKQTQKDQKWIPNNPKIGSNLMGERVSWENANLSLDIKSYVYLRRLRLRSLRVGGG